MKLLITGGAGYIGSHTAHLLTDAGHDLTIIDNLSSGHIWALPPNAKFIQGDISDTAVLSTALASGRFDALLHFAANIEVGESVSNPTKYYLNNTFASLQLFNSCIKAGIQKIIFSSTAAVYGNIDGSLSIDENSPVSPLSPYGRSKLMTEQILTDLAQASDNLKFVILRYFNVAGAKADLSIGQATPRATHLIKAAAEAAIGKRQSIYIYGDNYATPDGTCMRDYIHVDDLAGAHLNSLDYIFGDNPSGVFNIGYGQPYSVREVLETMRQVSKVDFDIQVAQRRLGDPASISANSMKAKTILGWKPRHNDLKFICETALKWEKKLSRM
ncbi:MAG: UDP-glucose 4-epimerase GalE [Proteobacteria bacterium]|nr:MAG: UDP-glucose 4-epimerase GalE [Pseudomonadota bacterium]